MKKWTILTVILLAGILSCTREGELKNPGTDKYSKVFIYCGLGYNNLSSYLIEDLDELGSGVLPDLYRDAAIVAFIHSTASSYDYNTPNPPVLLRIYRDKGKAVTDTLKVYPEDFVSASADGIREMLEDVSEMFPSDSYGMLFSSHATGWIPGDYSAYGESLSATALQELEERDESIYPLTKSLGQQNFGSSSYVTIDLPEFAAAIPIHLDYIIFDACLMGTVEVAWELREVCDRIVFSPAEVLADGIIYETLSWNLLSAKGTDLEAVCTEFFEHYNSLSGAYRSATITLMDCTEIEALADAFKAIVDAHGDALDGLDKSTVQKYFYNEKRLFFFFDLRDLAAALGADDSELAALDAALDACIPYHAETETFMNTLSLERCCGLSSYIPDDDLPTLNAYYSTLSWNQKVGLVK